MSFTLLKTDSSSRARRGRLVTHHGVIETPIFMPVGTQGTVKATTPDELCSVGAQVILGKTASDRGGRCPLQQSHRRLTLLFKSRNSDGDTSYAGSRRSDGFRRVRT